MEEEDAEPPIETSIGELEQWRLLAAVCPIFSYDHRWTALDSGKLHVKVIAKQADLFKANILEVPVHVPTEHVLVSNAYRDFELEINALLSSLECLVDGAKIPLCAAGEFELSFSLGIRRRCPNLLALHKLMVSNGETVTFEEYGQYLYLSQDVKTFKQIRFQVERFHTSTSKMLGDSVAAVLTTHTPAQAEQSPSAGPKIYFNRALWSSSKRLFESLVTNLKSCDRVRAEQTALNPDHKAMLHLSLTQDLQRSHEIGPEVCMALAACADQKSWHQTYCTISSANQLPPMPAASLESVCHAAEEAYEQQKVFKIELRENNFTDASDTFFGTKIPYSNADPVKPLSELLDAKILKDPYRFWPRDKKILAYTVANSLLQLYEGPWMQTLWSSDHLFFMYEPGADTVYNIHQPWISCILSETVPSMKPLESPDVIHSFPVILSFAKLLLELETGEELKAIKSGRSQKPSLLAALWEYCRTWSHRQLDEHYAEALEACVNFPKYFRIQQQEDLTTTVHDVILNRIVRPLEKRLDISQLGEWGKRNIDLRARVPITDPTGQIAFEGVSNNAECQVHEGRPRQAKQRPNVASSTVGSHGNKPRGIHGFARKQAQSTSQHKLGSEIPKKLDARLASGTQSFSPQTPSKVYVPSQTRSANNARRGLPVRVVENSSSRTSADSISKAIPATKKTHLTQKEDTYASAIKKFRSKTDVSSQPSSPSRTGPRNRRHSPKQNPNAPLSGFGKCLSHDLKAYDEISTASFNYINMTVDNRMLRQVKDRPIRIAVLDTGFDRSHADFQQARTKDFLGELGSLSNPEPLERPQCSRIVASRDFCRPSTANGGCGDNDEDDEDDVADLDGHGTKVAGILLRLAPYSELLIARVCLGEESSSLPENQVKFQTPQPDIVARAIEWAVRKDADVINLSLGFRNHPREKLASLRSALGKAQAHKVVVFAATANEGAHEPVAWPANDGVLAIGVHSCDDGGSTKSNFAAAPSPHGANFMAVGERILSQQLTSRGGGFCLCTGSSFATPVASAIGALVMAFTAQAVCHEDREEACEMIDLDDLHSNAGMIKVLKAISKQSGGYWYLSTRLLWANYRPHVDFEKDELNARQHAWRLIREALSP